MKNRKRMKEKGTSALNVMEGIQQPSQVNSDLLNEIKKSGRKELSSREYTEGILSGNRTILSKAITLIEFIRDGAVKKVIEVNEALCKGCGTCQATCPKRGVFIRGFTLDQITAQVEAALESA